MFFLQQPFLTWAAIWDYWFVQRNSKSPLFRHFTRLNFCNWIYPNHDPISVSGYFPFILTPATANVSSPGSVALCWHLNISRKGGLLICKGNGSSELPSLCSCFTSFIFKHSSRWVSLTIMSRASQCAVKATLVAAMFLLVSMSEAQVCQGLYILRVWVILDMVLWSCPGLH